MLKISKTIFLKDFKFFRKENEDFLRISQCSEMEASKSINYLADMFFIVPNNRLHVYVFLCHVWIGMMQCGKAMPGITNDWCTNEIMIMTSVAYKNSLWKFKMVWGLGLHIKSKKIKSKWQYSISIMGISISLGSTLIVSKKKPTQSSLIMMCCYQSHI